jgi:catechol 2,3-dioxygenase-like lactoylglutathione lyase family enzyme
MTIHLSHCFLAVDDPDKALEFYRDVLGFEVRNDVVNGSMRWITVGAVDQPDFDIVLEPPGAEGSAADRDVIADLMAKGIFGRLVFTTDDVDATFERVQAAGAEVIQEPIDQPWGPRDCAFRDPAGNVLRFNQSSGPVS